MANNLLSIIKTAAVEAVMANAPVNIYIGLIANLEPLSIMISEREITLDSDFFVFTQNVGELKKGDKLLLLCQQGGQRYFAIGKVVI